MIAGTQYTFQIQGRDFYANNLKEVLSQKSKVVLFYGEKSVEAQLTDDLHPGTYKVFMTLEQTGQYELKVEINDLLVPLHPSTITVTEKPISSAATSSFSGHSLLYQTGEKL
jgi:hypothetical protein